VESATAEQPRCDAFEISPTGPLVGYRMSLPDGKELELEQAALAEVALSPGEFRKAGKHKIKGARRPLRVRPGEVQLSGGVDENGGHITVAFTLPAGSYATMFIRELTKADSDTGDLVNENFGPIGSSPEVPESSDDDAVQTTDGDADQDQ